ncbi:MAG: ABC transporter permease [Prevotella sp.]|nr:ABC transporter permease [Prevotella sp.]MBR5061752.1 ABC transporter permease [Prevotella sp.]
MCHIWAKEMIATVKDEGVLIFFILVPLAYPLLYSWIYSAELVREVPVAVVDMSKSNMSRTFIRNYDATPDVKVSYHCNNIEEAKQLIGNQVVKGILYFPADFEKNVIRGKQSTLSVYCDMSIMLYYKAIYQAATAVSGAANTKIQLHNTPGNYTTHDEELSTRPLDIHEVPIFNSTGGYADFLIPGVLMLILHQTLILGIGLGSGTARETNRYRDLVPISHHYNGIFRIVLGKSLCYFMVYAIMGAYLTLVVPKLFGFAQIIGGKELLGLMVPYILATIFFGMMISCTIRYRENVMLIVVFASVPLLFLSGISWPQTDIPGAWRAVACIFPSTFGIRGFVRLNSMGATLADIKLEYQALWVQVAVYFFMTCAIYRFQIQQAHHHANEEIQRLRKKATEAKARKQQMATNKL